MKKRLSKKTLAEALGVSAPALSRYIRAGCPVDSVEAARDWQHRHVNPLQRLLRGAGRMPAADPAAEVHRLMLAAADDFDANADRLRAALRAVPMHARPGLTLDLTIMKRLLPAGLVSELGSGRDADDPEDLEYSAQVLYALAAGELVWK